MGVTHLARSAMHADIRAILSNYVHYYWEIAALFGDNYSITIAYYIISGYKIYTYIRNYYGKCIYTINNNNNYIRTKKYEMRYYKSIQYYKHVINKYHFIYIDFYSRICWIYYGNKSQLSKKIYDNVVNFNELYQLFLAAFTRYNTQFN